MIKLNYFNGNENYNEEFFPFNQFSSPGVVIDRNRDLDRLENRQRDGKDFEEFKRFMRKKILKKMRRQNKQDALQPTSFWDTVYGYTGFQGAQSYPQNYYGGWAGSDPNAMQNPYMNTYQTTASSQYDQILVQAAMFAHLTA